MIFTATDGLRIYYQSESPAYAPKADLLIVHGLGEHLGRYDRLAADLCAEGIQVHRLDLRGHGRSEGIRGHVQNFQQFFSDLDEWQRSLKAAGLLDSSRPRFLLGHSLGGLIAMDYCLHCESEPASRILGLILTSPAFNPRTFATALKPFLDLPVLAAVEQLHFPSGIEAKYLSHEREVIEEFNADPLVHGKITLRLFRELLTAAERVLQTKKDLPVPVLAFVAEEDHLVDSVTTIKFIEKISGSKELHLVRGAYHEIFNERKRKQAIGTLLRWMKEWSGPIATKTSDKNSSRSSVSAATKKGTSRSRRAKRARSIST